MSLTIGKGPFGQHPAGHFDFEPPERVVYVEAFPRRIRGLQGDEAVIDSDRAKLVHRSKALPHYSFPADDVRTGDAEVDPDLDGHVTVAWDAVDRWLEEDEEVTVHPRDPYHRIDTFATSRRVRVTLDGVELADSKRALALYETSLPVRYYLPREDVRTDLLVASDTVTQCAYKGSASHWSAEVGDRLHEDVAWSYEDDVRREAEPVQGRICFYNERVDIVVDDVAEERPVTAWSR